jgi:hypothetical protein
MEPQKPPLHERGPEVFQGWLMQGRLGGLHDVAGSGGDAVDHMGNDGYGHVMAARPADGMGRRFQVDTPFQAAALRAAETMAQGIRGVGGCRQLLTSAGSSR